MSDWLPVLCFAVLVLSVPAVIVILLIVGQRDERRR